LNENFGYSGEILRIDLSNGTVSRTPTAAATAGVIGGRGLAARIYWDEVALEVTALDPANRLIFTTGPLGGLTQLAGSRWQVGTKTPLGPRELFNVSNFGGSWGAYLKFAGFDAVVIHGQAEKPVYLDITEGEATIRDAAHLWGRDTVTTRQMLKSELGAAARVVACGPAGENRVAISGLIAEDDASGGCGIGAVMGAKNLKAVTVRGRGKVQVAHPEALVELIQRAKWLTRGAPMVQPLLNSPSLKTKRQACWGCLRGCVRSFTVADDGTSGKSMCAASTFYQARARLHYGKLTEVPFRANRLADALGIDIFALIPMLMWLGNCHREGVLDDEGSGLPLSQMGSLEFIQILLEKIASREGIGETLSLGTEAAAAKLGSQAQQQIADYLPYDPRIYITTGIFHATETRFPYPQMHEICRPILAWAAWRSGEFGTYVTGDVVRGIARRFWGGEAAVDYTTDDGKALCAKMIQDRVYAKESLGMCDNTWPILMVEGSEDHVGDPSLESQIYSAVTGDETNEAGLQLTGERVFTLHRAILTRDGREADKLPEFCHTKPVGGIFGNPEGMVPAPGEAVVYRKGAVLERAAFENIMAEYYTLRGWQPPSGRQTQTGLRKLDLDWVVPDLATRGLLADETPT
jgi:aldehyde:ferredoxin oxidoreductase